MPSSIADRKSVSKAAAVAAASFFAIQLFTATMAAHAQTYTLVYLFPQNAAGYAPLAPLIRNAEGDLLGTATAGGHFWGTLFKLKADGSMKVLHYFDRADGATPIGQLARDAEGNFYGTTSAGGSSFVGTIYKMDQSNNFTKLFQFHQFVGYSPWGGLTIDSTGNLYGTNTVGGGPGTSANEGDVFELSSAGAASLPCAHERWGSSEFQPSARLPGHSLRHDPARRELQLHQRLWNCVQDRRDQS